MGELRQQLHELLRKTVRPEFLNRIDEIVPVSYTHLRAHETVLDLVCRLLLEKKNTQKNHVAIQSDKYQNK